MVGRSRIVISEKRYGLSFDDRDFQRNIMICDFMTEIQKRSWFAIPWFCLPGNDHGQDCSWINSGDLSRKQNKTAPPLPNPDFA